MPDSKEGSSSNSSPKQVCKGGLLSLLKGTKCRIFSGSFLWRQLSIDNYHVKKYVKESQFWLFSRQKVYKNAKFVYISEIL
jgi:hypothetical protein